MSHHTVDARRLLCPIPVIRTQNAVVDLHAGDILEVTCTDPGALNDIPAWCRINGHTVLDARQEDDEIVITIEVGTRGA